MSAHMLSRTQLQLGVTHQRSFGLYKLSGFRQVVGIIFRGRELSIGDFREIMNLAESSFVERIRRVDDPQYLAEYEAEASGSLFRRATLSDPGP